MGVTAACLAFYAHAQIDNTKAPQAAAKATAQAAAAPRATQAPEPAAAATPATKPRVARANPRNDDTYALVSKDRESARQLLLEKAAVSEAERASYGQHLTRLRSGTAQSMETSNIHLETVRALKTINSLFASVAYPILQQSGDLLDSRLAKNS